MKNNTEVPTEIEKMFQFYLYTSKLNAETMSRRQLYMLRDSFYAGATHLFALIGNDDLTDEQADKALTVMKKDITEYWQQYLK